MEVCSAIFPVLPPQPLLLLGGQREPIEGLGLQGCFQGRPGFPHHHWAPLSSHAWPQKVALRGHTCAADKTPEGQHVTEGHTACCQLF